MKGSQFTALGLRALILSSHPPNLNTAFWPRQPQLLRSWSQTATTAHAPAQVQWPWEALSDRDWLGQNHRELVPWQLPGNASDTT